MVWAYTLHAQIDDVGVKSSYSKKAERAQAQTAPRSSSLSSDGRRVVGGRALARLMNDLFNGWLLVIVAPRGRRCVPASATGVAAPTTMAQRLGSAEVAALRYGALRAAPDSAICSAGAGNCGVPERAARSSRAGLPVRRVGERGRRRPSSRRPHSVVAVIGHPRRERAVSDGHQQAVANFLNDAVVAQEVACGTRRA